MFPSRFIVFLSLAVLFSVAGLVFHLVGGAALAFAWVATSAAFLGVLLLRDGHPQLRSTGASLVCVALFGFLAAAFSVPAHASAAVDLVWRGPGLASDLVALPADTAQLIAAPAGDNGFWGTVNGWLATGVGTVVAGVVTWAVGLVASHTKIKIRADQEAQIRETLKTGAYAAMHDLELYIDDHWTPAQRQKVLDKMVVWGEQRAAAQLKKLGLPNFVVTAMAGKVLGQLQGFGFNADTFDAAFAGGVPIGGNPGETPALDRAAGGTGGA